MSKKPQIMVIPIGSIRVINPRVRNKKKYSEIVTNISNIGLKRPIIVSRRTEDEGDDGYDLVCGQGRLEAFQKLGYTKIPAIVVNVSREERLLMSLIENVARRTPHTMEMVRQIGILRERGYNNTQIAGKIDVDASTVSGALHLLDHGEERLLQAVELGHIPVSAAIMIASGDDNGLQNALMEAYEGKYLRGRAIIRARKIMEQRKTYGKSVHRGKKKAPEMPTADAVVRAYNKEAQRKRLMIKKAGLCEGRLMFIINALRQLFKDENFTNLLRAEGLDTLPNYLAVQVRGADHS